MEQDQSIASPAADVGLLAVAVAFLLPVAFSPETYYKFWAPKAAVCLLLLIPGLVALGRLVRAGSKAAIVAALFVVAAGISTLLSDRPILSLVGLANWGTGSLFVAGLAAAWALGSVISDRRREQVVLAIIGAALVNAVVAWLQARGFVPPALESPGRSGGLLGHPVHLGALCAGALWLVGDRIGRARGHVLWAAPIVLIAGAAQLSGGRSAAGLAFLAVVAAVWRSGLSSVGGRTRAAVIVVAAVVGFALGPAGVEGAVLGSARVAGAETATHEVGLRVDVWRIGLEASLDRPVLGWGPGRVQAATSTHYTPEVAGGGLFAWQDPHNWIVEYAVTTGALGLLLLVAWLVLAARTSRGPLAGFAATIGLFMLVEPQTVGLVPLAMLALGAANRDRPVVGVLSGSRAHRLAILAGSVPFVAAALVLLVGQVFMYHASLDTSVASFNKAHSLLPPWPEVSYVGSRTEAFYGLHSERHATRSLALAREATRRDPADTRMWSYLGFIELKWGTKTGAATAFDRALERNPWAADGLRGRVVLAEALGDEVTLRDSCKRLRILKQEPLVACRPEGGADSPRPQL